MCTYHHTTSAPMVWCPVTSWQYLSISHGHTCNGACWRASNGNICNITNSTERILSMWIFPQRLRDGVSIWLWWKYCGAVCSGYFIHWGLWLSILRNPFNENVSKLRVLLYLIWQLYICGASLGFYILFLGHTMENKEIDNLRAGGKLVKQTF